MPRYSHAARVDGQGHIILPPEMAQKMGIQPGDQLWVSEGENEIRLRRPVSHLARVYIEVTNTCNLDCRTCMRNVWDEPLGSMDEATFRRIEAGVRSFSPPPLVFFGGFGEPLSHPNIISMIRRMKDTGASVECITNATLLNKQVIERLCFVGLDKLWVSLDGASPESYSDVRLGAALPDVINNMMLLRDYKEYYQFEKPHVGVAFVAMKRNIHDLPAVIEMGMRFGAQEFSISNVLAHTPELRREILYEKSMYDGAYNQEGFTPLINAPRMDINEVTLPALGSLIGGKFCARFAGQEFDRLVDRCPFVEKGSLSVRWDGQVSPCLPLLHSHASYLDDRVRRSKTFSFGSVLERSLADLWNDPAYVQLRERLMRFDFSPCTFCNSCELADENHEDCYGNLDPTCGGCLWAQGLIQCP